MYFGQNAFNLVMANIQPLVLLGIAIIGLVLLVQHKAAGVVTVSYTHLDVYKRQRQFHVVGVLIWTFVAVK